MDASFIPQRDLNPDTFLTLQLVPHVTAEAEAILSVPARKGFTFPAQESHFHCEIGCTDCYYRMFYI